MLHLEDLPLHLNSAFTHAAPLPSPHLVLKVDCARQSVQRKNRYCLQSHNCNSPLLRVPSVDFLIFFGLRSASLSPNGYQLCLTCISSVQDHLQIPHLPSGKMLGPGRTWTETATHLLSRPRRSQTGTIARTAGLHTTSWRFKSKTQETAFL